MAPPIRPVRSWFVRVLVLIGAFLAGTPDASAQEPFCGDGTTFTVNLPSVAGGDGDAVTLPNGCRIYALLVSGYERNKNLDEGTFYNLAKFVMDQDGYVHWSWWNNLLSAYMTRPLHRDETITFPGLGERGPSPGGLLGVHAAGFAPSSDGLPKAVPEDDHQFQADALAMLEAIRSRNPDALIIVAGHSMGGGAVARLGANTTVDIDLLAPIDPVGNRTSPVGRPSAKTYNWTRWRATHGFRGFRQADCVRNAAGFCRNFGTVLQPQYRCEAVGPYRNWPLVPPSFAPLVCPNAYADPGTRITFSGRIKRLYHRWQLEALFPFDYTANEYYGFWEPRNAGNLVEAHNIQQPVPENAPGEDNRLKTCSAGFDPRDHSRLCNPGDGHGEIVGFRSPTAGQPNPPGPNAPVAPLAVQFRGVSDGDSRRQLLEDMRDHGSGWSQRPVDPDLDMVSDDMVTIVTYLLHEAGESRPPATTPTLTPGANDYGWHNEDVTVTLTATAQTAGASVRSIEYSLSGAQQQGATVHPGSEVEVVISAEGETRITFFARDSEGNVESPQEVVVLLDKTPPAVSADVSPGPNAHGWNNGDVGVAFTAVDELSGIDVVDPARTLTSEGSHEVVGTATDRAGNAAAVVLTINIDKTAPVLSGLPSACVIWPPTRQLVPVGTVLASDALSGVASGSPLVTATSSEPETSDLRPDRLAPDIVISNGAVQVRAEFMSPLGRVYTINASAQDLAGNSTHGTAVCRVTKPMPVLVKPPR